MRKIAPVLLAVIIMGALLLPAVLRPRPKSPISAQVVPTLTISGGPDNFRVTGKWVFTLTVNTYEAIDLLMSPPDVQLSDVRYIQNIQNLTGMKIPADVAQLRARKAVRVLLTPLAEKPFLVGRVYEAEYVYGDGTGATRAWKFWDLGPWTSFLVPYKVKVSQIENGIETKVLAERVILAGPTEWGGQMVYAIPEYGITIANLGMLLQGQMPPDTDRALVYLSPTEARWVKRSLLHPRLTAAELGKTPPCMVKIALVSADPASKEMTESYYHYHDDPWYMGWQDIKVTTLEGYPSLSSTPKIHIRHTEEAYTNKDYVLTYSVVATSPGFDPENVFIAAIVGNAGEADKLYLTQRVPGKLFDLKIHAADGQDRDVVFGFVGAADTWREVAGQTGVVALPGVTDPIKFYTSAPGWFTAPGRVWDMRSLYADNCPTTTGVWGTVRHTDEYVVLAEAPSSFATAMVRVEAPLELFDAYLYIPPWGVPKIQKVEPDPLELGGGSTGTVTVTVKNESEVSGDTFYIQFPEKLPDPLYCTGSDVVAVGPGETVQMKVSFKAGRVEEEKTVEIPFLVKALGSSKEDRGTIRILLKPGYGPPETYSSVTVVVVDKKDRRPIEAAAVYCAGAQAFTDSQGKAVFDKVRVGTQTIRAEKPGYYARSVTAEVRADQTNVVTIELSRTREEAISPLLIAAIASAVAVGTGAAYYFYRRRR